MLTGPGAVTDDLTPITVAGFPAVLARPRNPDFCSVDVDVAAASSSTSCSATAVGEPAIPQDQLCRDAPIVAEQVVPNMLSR